MKSIRRTLLLTVLCVLLATLGVVSVVVYRLTADSLREKQKASRDRVQQRYEEFQDEELRSRAEILARDVQQNFQRDKWWHRWEMAAILGAVPSSAFSPSGQAPLLTSLATWLNNPIAVGLNTRAATELTLVEDETYHNTDYEFVQMTADWSAPWKSRSLGSYNLPLDQSTFRREGDSKPVWDFVDLPDGTRLRRITVKAPIIRYGRSGTVPGFGRRTEGPHPSRAVVGLGAAARNPVPRAGGPTIVGPPPPGMEGFTLPTFYLQCAWDTSANNPMLREKLAQRDEQLAELDEETDRSISNLRSTLAWTVGGAIGVTLLLGWFLVGVGLFPLKRLSYAVSQITPNELHLPIDPRTLPAEVNPVAERLSQALTQLQAAFEREKRAAADISHELRTPIAALTTTLEVACRKTRTAEQYRQTLEDCRGITKQMSLLVERLLTLAWLDSGADEVRSEKVEVGELVGGVAAVGKPLAEAHGLSFHVNVPGPITIRTDPDKLREVVMNLIHNAIEYNRPGGEVEVTAAPTGRGVVLEVRDTGIGMAPEIQAKIFERFFRADPSRQATGVHAGLGLAIVREYVDRLGGRLTVESAVGRGSRFRVELPNAL